MIPQRSNGKGVKAQKSAKVFDSRQGRRHWKGSHRVEQELIPVLAGDGDEPVARVSTLHDADVGLAVLCGPAAKILCHQHCALQSHACIRARCTVRGRLFGRHCITREGSS